MSQKPVTTADMKLAIETSHDTCEPDCLHVQALVACRPELAQLLNEVTEHVAEIHGARVDSPKQMTLKAMQDLMYASLFAGIHVGYRLAHIELGMTEEAKGTS